jgi:hypothetical protein
MSLGEQQGRSRQNANAGSRMGGSDSQWKNESPQHVVYGRPAMLAARRVWHLQQHGNMGGTGRLLQACLLADDTKGRSEGDCTSGTLPNGPWALRCRVHTSRSGMSSGPDQKLLVHYGCRLGNDLQMAVSMELLMTELGVSSQPLGKSFQKYGKWVTHSWLQSLLEKVDEFDVTVEIAPIPIDPPRMGDRWFMRAVIKAGYRRPEELEIINCFRCYQQVIHVSDVLEARGRCLDKKISIAQTRRGDMVNVDFSN